MKYSTCLTLLSYFASSLKVRPVCCEAVSTTARTWRHTRWWVSILFCLFVCLSVWGRLALARLFHLYPSPWQRSSRDTQLSSNTPTSHSWPRQQTAVEEPVSLICLSSTDSEAPLGGCHDITGCLGDSLVAAARLCSALFSRFNSSYGSVWTLRASNGRLWHITWPARQHTQSHCPRLANDTPALRTLGRTAFTLTLSGSWLVVWTTYS